jgi:hypothetical protein
VMAGTGPTFEMAKNDANSKRMKLVPWGGVAAKLPNKAETSGVLFCSLPLPTLLGLPVHSKFNSMT